MKKVIFWRVAFLVSALTNGVFIIVTAWHNPLSRVLASIGAVSFLILAMANIVRRDEPLKH